MKKKAFPKFGNGKGMKKSIPNVRERESEASILGNVREREFPLTPEEGLALTTLDPKMTSENLSKFRAAQFLGFLPNHIS